MNDAKSVVGFKRRWAKEFLWEVRAGTFQKRSQPPVHTVSGSKCLEETPKARADGSQHGNGGHGWVCPGSVAPTGLRAAALLQNEGASGSQRRKKQGSAVGALKSASSGRMDGAATANGAQVTGAWLLPIMPRGQALAATAPTSKAQGQGHYSTRLHAVTRCRMRCSRRLPLCTRPQG